MQRTLAVLVLLAVALAAAARRWRETASPPLSPCVHPIAVASPERLQVICAPRDRLPLQALAHEAGLPCRTQAEDRVPARRLVRFDERCRASVEPLPARLRLTLGLPLDINSTSAEGLCRLPRIGPVLAARIIRDRQQHGPYPTVAALTRVRGIGPKTVARLQGLVCVDQDHSRP